MSKIGFYINKLSNAQKFICLILILSFVLLLAIGIPTLARLKNRNIINTVSVWDGSIANDYRKGTGTESDPYIISNGSELAYFYTQLSITDYDNTYFALSNDIVLNKGIFNYDLENGIQYILDDQTYYIENYSDKYYDNVNRDGTEIGSINNFYALNNFKGNFDGSSFRIFGLYITDQDSDELALFTNLEGNIYDLYVENSVVYGGITTAGIASTSNNTSLRNILFDGYVIGRNTNMTKNINTNPTAPIMEIGSIEATEYINLSNNIPFIGSEIVSTSITGDYVIDGSTEEETTIKINGVMVNSGSFEIDLGSAIKESIPITSSTTSISDVSLTLSNLSYNITYNYTVSAGIVANPNNTTMENIINKAFVYGYSVGGGLAGVTTSPLDIKQSYNVGNINSENVSGGLIGVIEKSNNNMTILKSYNIGKMSALNVGGLIGMVDNNTGSISITNTFDASSDYSIGTVYNTVVNVTDTYYINGATSIKEGTVNGNFTSISIDDLNNKDFVMNTLLFNEFVSFDDTQSNRENVWIYEQDSLPILFIDDLNNPVANLNASFYSWNNLSYDLGSIRLDSNITFSIEGTDELEPLKEIYYYVSNSRNALSKEEILQIDSWNSYDSIVQVSDEGTYVIYVKVIDYNDNVSYINSDLLILDFSGSSVSISFDDNTWTSLKSDLYYIYIDREKHITVEAEDDLSGISSVKYYITDQVLNVDNLNGLSESNWITYSDEILINEINDYIVYVRVIDDFNHVTYVNTDYIVLNGYTQTGLTIGRDSSSYHEADVNISNKSTVSLDLNYSSSSTDELINHTHNLMSNILLPLGTKITLIDRSREQVYEYQVTTDTDIYNYNNSCDGKGIDCTKTATYPLTLFKEVGTGLIGKPYTEGTYYQDGVVNENFTIVLDLSKTNTELNYNDVNLFMELHDSSGVNIRPTLYKTLKQFNIYSTIGVDDASANLYLTTDYSGNPIIYNSDSSTDISFMSGINYKSINESKIIDTTYEDKIIGLSIKMVDGTGNVMGEEYLKNIIFKIGENIYYPEDDNIIRINLKNGIKDVTSAVTIKTSLNNNSLDEGTYYIKISNYASKDGYYYDNLGEFEINIPILVSNNSNINYSFDVIMDDANHIINKNDGTVSIAFDILQNGDLEDPSIMVSLYKKNELTAYDQGYLVVDLLGYVSNELNNYESNIYYVTENPIQYDGTSNSYNNFELNLLLSNFENTGYKFVFDLYDGSRKIGTIEKYFIVR